jgi:hypothetical protein
MELALRPMSTAQVLDRTFYLYRNNFVLFAGIAIITPALRLIALLVQLKIFGPITIPQTPEGFTPQFMQTIIVRAVIGFVVASVIYLIGTAFASSATAYAVSMVHLGKTTTISESYSRIKPIFLKILWLLCLVVLLTVGPLILFYALILGLGLAIPFLARTSGLEAGFMMIALVGIVVGIAGILGSVVWFIYAICRYALAVTASTLEKLPARAALIRTKFLTYGRKWSILGILILTWLLSFVLTYVLQLPALLANSTMVMSAKTHLSIAATIWIYIAGFLGETLAGPIITIALVLVYYDQRVRKEAFDLQLMMEAVGEQAQMPSAATQSTGLAL